MSHQTTATQIEALRTNTAVRDAFVDCYTAYAFLVGRTTGLVGMLEVTSRAVSRCNDAERELIRTILDQTHV